MFWKKTVVVHSAIDLCLEMRIVLLFSIFSDTHTLFPTLVNQKVERPVECHTTALMFHQSIQVHGRNCRSPPPFRIRPRHSVHQAKGLGKLAIRHAHNGAGL